MGKLKQDLGKINKFVVISDNRLPVNNGQKVAGIVETLSLLTVRCFVYRDMTYLSAVNCTFRLGVGKNPMRSTDKLGCPWHAGNV